MKKILVLLMVVIGILLFAADEYTVQLATVGDQETVVTSAVLTYADNNEHAFTLDNAQAYFDIYYYAGYSIEIQIIYTGNPNDVNLLIGVGTSGQSVTAINAISQFDVDYWAVKTIDLNTSGGTSTECFLLPEGLLSGKYLYFKHQYSGDPGNDPKIAIYITKI